MKLSRTVAVGSILSLSAMAHEDGFHHRGHHGKHGHGGMMHEGHHHDHPIPTEPDEDRMYRPEMEDAEPPMMPHTHVAYHHVEKACSRDVELLCTPQELATSLGDPFLDWMFLPYAEAPMEDMDDVSDVMDRFMQSVFDSPQEFTTITIISPFAAAKPADEPVNTVQDIHFVADSAAAKFAQEKEPEELPELVGHLQAYGEHLMETHAEGNPKHHLGRRLTEMNANTLHRRAHLPFGCQKNACLMNAIGQSIVSPDCEHAIEELQIVNYLEHKMEHRRDTAMRFMSLYSLLLVGLLVLMAKKVRRTKMRRRLGNKILQAVYANPQLKRQVEEELGESVGNAPPIPFFGMKMMGAHGKNIRRKMRCMRCMHKICLVFLFLMLVVDPLAVFPLCIMIMAVRGIFLCFVMRKYNSVECQCCCCKATTTQAALGTLNPEQQCCSCCKGTGVCSPSCKSCCGGNDQCADPCCCSGDSCCNTKDLEADCTCCCCKATPQLAKAGLLTVEQECCKCCKGTGKCSAACASCCGSCCCCGGDGCCCCCGGSSYPSVGKGKKHVFKAKEAVYHGIPVQVV